MKNTKIPIIAGIAFVTLVILLGLSSSMFLTIDSGQKGVLFRKFGGGLDKENVYSQGFHVIAPWNQMFVYDVRVMELTEEMDVLAKNGLNIHIDLSIRYRPVPDKIGFIHDNIGKDYRDKIVIPEIRSSTRKVIGKYLPEELYSSKREVIQTEIFDQTNVALHTKDLILDAALIRAVKLPTTIQTAIESKLKQEQESQQYEFRIQKAQKEAERLKIEAEGKAQANRILNASLSTNILKEKGIEATLELASSPNSKVIVVGDGDGLPLILGNN